MSILPTHNENEPIDNIIVKFSNHPSIININNNIKKSTFSFNEILNALDSKKACKSNSIPVKLIKEYSSICNEPLKNLINRGLRTFDQNLKYADLTPVHKKDDTTDKKTIAQLVYFLLHQKSLKGLWYNKLELMWINF